MSKVRAWSKADVEEIPIESIEIGERRREKLGPIAKLAESIGARGLIHPIVVTQDGVLVAGRRRLAAMERLGWKKVPVRRFERMTEDELRAMEIEENTRRLDLSDYELSKKMVSEAEAEEVAEPRPQKGRGKKGGEREQARKAGVPRSTLQDAKRHVAAAEEIPALQRPDWTRGQALETKKALDAMPQDARDLAVEMISEEGTPAKDAVQIVKTLSDSKAREKIEPLYRSPDEEERSLAKTTAAQRPPVPPKRLTWLRDALRCIDRTIEDSINVAGDDLASARSLIQSALKKSEDFHARRRARKGL